MSSRAPRIGWALVAVLAMGGLVALAKKKPEPIDCKVTVHVFNRNHQAIANAGVVLTQVGDLQWQKVKDPLHVELKSDSKGNASISGFVPGVLLVQVIASGYQTWGDYYYVRHADELINIELKRPQRQISIYR